jgi:hypothetical protein
LPNVVNGFLSKYIKISKFVKKLFHNQSLILHFLVENNKKSAKRSSPGYYFSRRATA